jgi:hypothetical protein
MHCGSARRKLPILGSARGILDRHDGHGWIRREDRDSLSPRRLDIPASVVTLLGTELTSRGFIVDVMTATQSLAFDQGTYSALVLGSPVYGAEIRPPIKDFVVTNAPFSAPVFAILTGMFPDLFESNDLPTLIEFLSQYGVALEAAAKIGTGWDERRIGEQIIQIADKIEEL